MPSQENFGGHRTRPVVIWWSWSGRANVPSWFFSGSNDPPTRSCSGHDVSGHGRRSTRTRDYRLRKDSYANPDIRGALPLHFGDL